MAFSCLKALNAIRRIRRKGGSLLTWRNWDKLTDINWKKNNHLKPNVVVKKVCSCWCKRRREKTIVRLMMMMMMMMMMMILIATTHRVCFTLFAVLYGVYESKSCCCHCHRRCCCCCCCSCCCAVVQLVAAVGSGGDGVGAHPMRPCWSMMHALSRTEGCNGSQGASRGIQ